MRASPIRIPTVTSDTDWDFCFHLSQQTKIPEHQRTDESSPTSGSEESEEDTKAKEKVIDHMSHPREKLAQSQKKIAQLIKGKKNIEANKELIRCVTLSRIIFGEEHWKCAQALATLAYGYLTLRGLPAQAKKHAESAKNVLLTWKGTTTSDKEEKQILETLVMLYYTLGVVCLLQNQYPFLPSGIWGSGPGASLANCRLNLALVYFEKAVDNVIANKGDSTSELVSLYQEIAQIEQLRRNHEQAIQYLHQAHSICVSLYTEVSPQAAEASALLAKAYAMSGEVQHKDAVGLYFMKSITAYQTTLGPEDYETLTTVEEFCKWLVQNGEKREAYRLLKASLRSQVISYGDCSEKVAETLYNMGKICFAKGELRKAVQLLRKCLMIQILIYGDEHSKSRDTKNLLTLMQRWRLELEESGKNRKELTGGESFRKGCGLWQCHKRHEGAV
ncbi:TPA: tetratricopeptide repeat domain 23-like [Bos taurus]|nr:TPA: tetratricopeptide repeat domain 23-like [Bos taurus]